MRRILATFFVATMVSTVSAQEKITPEQEAFFEKHIRPALVNYCYECHSLEGGKTLGGLLLDTRESIREGGDSGPAIEPGDIHSSVIWEAINWDGYEMPPKQKMPDDVIQKFKEWIEMGAPDPREREVFFVESEVDIEEGKKHWAFQKPELKSGSIDQYINAKLDAEGVTPSAQADAFTLLRRLNFDLVGLPPTVDEAKSFFAEYEKNPTKAIENKVDELLARPQYGERWGRHWLDIARYAESSGKINFSYPHAWRYRDFVIDAFNKDTPYDHFVKQQIAGDLLPAKTDEVWQENLLGTGFLTIGVKSLNERNPRVFNADLVDEQIDAVSRTFLGLTVSCARCHDHKYDPIPTVDYYSLAGIFQSTDTYFGTVSGQQNHRPSDLLLLPIVDQKNPGKDFSQAEIKQMQAEMDKTRKWLRERRADANDGGREVVQREMVAARNKISRIQGILDTLDGSGQAKTFGMGVQDSDAPRNAKVLKGGDVEKQAQEVERGFLQVLNDVKADEIRGNQSGRKQLAQWLTSEDNPLTARVMVNRVWLKLFGEGLVRSPNNWGLQGEAPSHPELLDYLATDFMDNDWSVKKLIKQIVLSDAYQRSSEFNADSFKADSENKLIWRMTPRQLDAEALYDSMLAISGKLKYDRPYASEIAELGDFRLGRVVNAESLGQNHLHRAVYLPIVRDQTHESLKLFDFADNNAPNAKRDSTNVASQALYLMNSPFVISSAEKMAANLITSFSTTKERVRWAFIQAYGRGPTDDEFEASVRFFNQFEPQQGNPSADNQSRRNGTRRNANAGNRENSNGPGAGGQRGQRGQRGMQGGQPGNGGQRGMQAGQRGMQQGGQRGMGDGNPLSTPRGGRRRQATGPTISVESMTPEHQFLTLFCQSLIASAEFRILN